MLSRLLPLCCVFLLIGASAARAQDKGQVGLTMAYPASVGVVWHVTDRLALRPDFTVTRVSSETTVASTLPPSSLGSPPTQTTSGDTWAAAFGFSALWYVHTWDRVRVFISPRVTYSRTSSQSRSTVSNQPGVENSGDTWGGSGSFGAQAAIATRFAVFGEVGLAYSSAQSQTVSGTIRLENSTRSTGARAGVGIVFYF